MAKITGIAMWASVQEPNTTFDPKYCVDLIVSKEKAKKLKEHGLKTVPVDKVSGASEFASSGDRVLRIRKPVFSKSGKELQKPYVIDANGNPFSELIGNGSKVTVEFNIFEYEAFGQKGKNAKLVGVKVLEHVPYHKDDGLDFDEDDSNTFDDEELFD